MVKNIIILVLSVLCVSSSIYAYRQKGKAEDQESVAAKIALGNENLKGALQSCQMEAEKWHEIAIENERKAIECLQGR